MNKSGAKVVRSKRPVSTGCRLFVIGAGLSYGAGMPDAARVLPHLMLYCTGPWAGADNRTPMEYFTPLLPELLNMVSLSKDGKRFPLDQVAGEFGLAMRRDFRKFYPLVERFNVALREMLYQRSWECAGKLLAFASHLRAGDIVVSFNWDLCLEIAMASLNLPFRRSFALTDRQNAVRLFKLHGSIDDLIVHCNPKASVGRHTIFERYGIEVPIEDSMYEPDQPKSKCELIRLKTYDLPIRGTYEMNAAKKEQTFKILGDKKRRRVVLGYPDLFPLQLDALLGPNCGPCLFTPATSRGFYDWMYNHLLAAVTSLQRRITSTIIVGYSFPPYDVPVLKVLAQCARHLNNGRTVIVNPAADQLPRTLLDQTFDAVELHSMTADEFDWSTV